MLSEPQLTAEKSDLDLEGQQPPLSEEKTYLDMALRLIEHRKFITLTTFVTLAVSTLIIFLIPNQYTAITKVLPPQQAQSSVTAMLGQIGALAGLAGGKENLLGLKNPSDLYVGILKSRSIEDALIDQFDLKRLYRDKKMTDAREDLEDHTTITTEKSGLISVAFTDKDPTRASAVANAYIEQLYRANKRLAISEASQRRLFYEKELSGEKDELANAEVELKQTEEKTGLIQLNSQAEAIIRSSSLLKAQITAKEVQLQGLRSFSTEQNPALIRVEGELGALKAQMNKLENDQKVGSGNIQIPTGRVPEVGLEYVRKVREVKYHEVLFELLAKQYEAARIDEGKNAPIIQVIDTAIPPDKKSWPPRSIIIALSTGLGAILACLYVLIKTGFFKLQTDSERQSRLLAMRHALNMSSW